MKRQMMKKTYTQPLVEITIFNLANIIATSGTGGSTSGGAWGARKNTDNDFDFIDDFDFADQ